MTTGNLYFKMQFTTWTEWCFITDQHTLEQLEDWVHRTVPVGLAVVQIDQIEAEEYTLLKMAGYAQIKGILH